MDWNRAFSFVAWMALTVSLALAISFLLDLDARNDCIEGGGHWVKGVGSSHVCLDRRTVNRRPEHSQLFTTPQQPA